MSRSADRRFPAPLPAGPPTAATNLRRLLARPTLGPNTATLLVAAYLALTQNLSFLHAVAASLPQPFTSGEWRIAVSAALTMYALIALEIGLFAFGRLLKPVLTLFLVGGAVCSYFMDNFGTVIDNLMIVNVVKTDAREAGDLLRADFFLHVLVAGALPAWLISCCHIRTGWRLGELGRRLLLLAGLLSATSGMILLQYQDLALWGREHRDVRLYVNPLYPFYSAYRYIREALPTGPEAPLLTVGADAVRPHDAHARALLVVIVVGETARAANFSLNGYARHTNPRLSQLPGLINYTDTRSCGTATAESVPCMFSRLDRSDFSRSAAAQEENILDVMKRVGVNVIWRDNDSGCQGVCARTGVETLDDAGDPQLCANGECRDGILLKNLEQSFPTAAGSATLLVLHQKGSHGPAYFKRYPDSARRFTPDCRDESVQRCTREEIVNAYDNTIVYTDAVLADLIGILERYDDRMDSVMLYVSDHGESLGENGLYLHGMPYRLAPDLQTHIPMMAWFSHGAQRSLDLDSSCLRAGAGGRYSHDHLFSSLLGLLGVQTREYTPDEDLYGECRGRSTTRH